MHFLMLGCQIRLDNRATESEAGSHSVDELRRQAKLGSLWHRQVLRALQCRIYKWQRQTFECSKPGPFTPIAPLISRLIMIPSALVSASPGQQGRVSKAGKTDVSQSPGKVTVTQGYAIAYETTTKRGCVALLEEEVAYFLHFM